jgi:hypothetical protein
MVSCRRLSIGIGSVGQAIVFRGLSIEGSADDKKQSPTPLLIAIDNAPATRTENMKPCAASAGFKLGALPVIIPAVESQSG